MTSPRPRILVVDDDPTARLLMRAALRKAGYEVELAVSGEDALLQFNDSHFDLVMLDVEMPGMNGHQVCADLRRQAGDLLPVVMVTGMDDVESVERAYESGATDFLAKPIHWALIGHRVKYLLRGHQALIDLGAAQARHAAILEAIPDLLFELDLDGRYLDYHSPRARRVETRPGELIGRTIWEILPRVAAQACHSALRTALVQGYSSDVQYQLPLDQGGRWYELSVSRKNDERQAQPSFIVLSRDITERKVAEDRITRLAYFDSLTGLPNRQSFLERVDREFIRAGQRGQKLGVLFMDLDGFKNVNDTMGHSAGDLILKWAADRLAQGLRPSDALGHASAAREGSELSRLGGDEFTALILDIARPDEAIMVAHRVGELMRRPFVVDGRNVTLTTSIGIAIYPDDGTDAATLLKHADTAMYHAKATGRDNARLYTASLTVEAMERMELDTSLRLALERNEFHLVYQPQIDIQTGCATSVEALIRWTHPVRGLVPPFDFIPLAEQNGLIERIGQWVLRTACTDAAAWNREGRKVCVAVNLSPVQFRDPGLLQMVVDTLAETGLPPDRLELEVTEGALMENTASTIATLHALRDHGVCIALDDFGTGYSSLSYLTRMPINRLKVDRCFVNGLLDGGEHSAIVRAVLAMADTMGMNVTAEGVETLEQARALKRMECDSLQGFYFSRPVMAQEISALLDCRWPLDGKPAAALRAGPLEGSTPIEALPQR
ncbi:MAG TPA: EAL domain-containing protein [Burkholderiaceae bacterium]|nr:EAL domain-containing protein [Burkholderiaceae bacterium]